MNFSKAFIFQQKTTLTSGRFYWIQIKLYSYQINEVERFQKHRILHIAGYLDSHETVHYFHGLKNKFSAHSSLAELASIEGFYDWDFQELDHQFAIQVASERLTNPDDQLFQKLIVEFLPSSQVASEKKYCLEQLLLDYLQMVKYAELKTHHS